MITPKKNDEYQFDFLKVHKQLQEEIIRDIARRISVTDFTLTETARWQAEKAMQCGILYDEVLRQVGKKTAISRKEIEAIFDDARLEVFDYDEELLAVAGYSVQSVKNLSPAMKRIMAAAISKTRDDVENLTMTTAVTSQASYISACDLAHMQIVSGAFSYQDAIRNAIKRAAADGVSVIYPSGHESSLDAAVRRAVLTGVNQSCGRLQEMRATELGCDLMEITAHLGSRPDHALWQGQVVSLSGRAGYLSLSDIGYGDVRGFQGANCRHNWYMFFEGVSSPAYSQEELREWREGTVSFDGVQIPLYEAIQKQRSMERAIRRSKQELVALDEAVKSAADVDTKQTLELEFERAAVRLKGQEARLSDFCEKTGLDRDRYREQVFAAKTERGIRGFGRSTSMRAVWANRRYLTNMQKNDIIVSRDSKVTINSIELPIEQRNTAKGNPNAILLFERPLNNRQQKLLDMLPDYDSRIIVKKKDVSMRDLAALTAKVGNEFAMFTKGNTRLIIRGDKNSVNIDVEQAKELCEEGYKWSGHTHPGITDFCMEISDGDFAVWECFAQEFIAIYNSKGNYRTYMR